MSSVRRLSIPEQQYVNNFAKWQSDKDVSQCMNCHKGFSFFLRRHHCRCCGNIFCDDCTSHFVHYDKAKVNVVKRPENGDDFAPYRTCDVCYNSLLNSGLIISVPKYGDISNNGSADSLSNNSDHASLSNTTVSGLPSQMEDTTTSDVPSLQQHEQPNATVQTSNSGGEEVEQDDDSNRCPICNVDLETVAPDHEEIAIEQHIENCIKRAERIQQHHNRNGPVSPESNNQVPITNEDLACPTSRNRMLVYKIPYPGNDKNSPINEDDYEECPICFEQMLPSEKVGRLECLCVFHYHCIKSWFTKKSQQLPAAEGLNTVGKNFCPLHDAVF